MKEGESYMSLLDMYRNSISRKKSELAKLHTDKATETSKISNYRNKILNATQAIQRTQSISTIQSKYREIESAEKSIISINKRIADIEAKIGKKTKEIVEEESKYNREHEREQRKIEQIERKRLQDSERQLKSFNNQLTQHSRLHIETQRVLVDLQKVPEKVTVLFMASNPLDQDALRLDEEAREINEMIRKSENRDSISFITRWAVRPLDILQAINETNPSIVHFSGHGSEESDLVLQDANGQTKLISRAAIVHTMMTCAENIRLVFFNTCFSYGQAQEVIKHIEAAIGMNESIGDEAARIFSAQFYSSIGFGFSVQKSFEQAKAALMLEGISEENTPQLYIKEGLNAEEIIIVRP